MNRGRAAAVCGALVWTVIAAGCGREASRPDGAGGPEASAPAAAPAEPALALPDLSRAAVSVQEQIREVHASVRARLQDPATDAAGRAAAYGELGRLLMAAEFGAEAEACLRGAEALAPGDARWPYLLGHLYKEQGAPEQSRGAFERALRLQPDDVPTLLWLGEADLAAGRPDLAEPRFLRARTLRPRAAAAHAGLGRAALAKREWAAAVSHLQEALALEPQVRVVHYSLGLAYRGLGDTARAESHLANEAKAEIQIPDPLMNDIRGLLNSASAYESLGIAALEQGDAARAADYFRKGLAVASDSASLHQRLGTALILGGDARAGQVELEQALRIDPGFARAHYSLGVLAVSAGRYEPAVARLSSAVEHDPDYVDARLLLADLLRRGGRAGESLPHYRRAIALAPGIADAQLGLALALVGAGQYAQARDALIGSARAHPDRAEFTEALVRVLAAAPDAAVRDAGRAVALAQQLVTRPRTPELAEAVAMAHAAAGDFPQAEAWQREAIAAADGAGREAHVRLAMAENLRLFQRREPCRTPWREGTMP